MRTQMCPALCRLGFAPAQPRAKGRRPLDSRSSLALAGTLSRPFRRAGKEMVCSRFATVAPGPIMILMAGCPNGYWLRSYDLWLLQTLFCPLPVATPLGWPLPEPASYGCSCVASSPRSRPTRGQTIFHSGANHPASPSGRISARCAADDPAGAAVLSR